MNIARDSKIITTANLTDFQRKVLQAIKKIPKGRVVTYQEVARKIGRPKAFRAVGNALRVNPWAPKIPCHRVIKTSGEIGGYGPGRAKKIKLLEEEGLEIRNNQVMNFNAKFIRL